VIKAPVRAPQAKAHAERWVGSLRRECLERILIVGRRQLEQVVRAYIRHHNEHRPHRSLEQRPPLSKPPPAEQPSPNQVGRRDRLGGWSTSTTRSPRKPAATATTEHASTSLLGHRGSNAMVFAPQQSVPSSSKRVQPRGARTWPTSPCQIRCDWYSRARVKQHT
jgi:hypothetical protein